MVLAVFFVMWLFSTVRFPQLCMPPPAASPVALLAVLPETRLFETVAVP